MYNNIVFNLYGTLIDIKTNEEKDEIWEKFAIYFGYNGAHYEKDELKERYSKIVNKLIKNNDKYECPDYEIEDVFFKLYKDKGVKPKKKAKQTAKTFRLLSTEYIKLYDGVIETLEKLVEQNKKIYLLSNAQKAFANAEIKYLKIKKYFNDTCISSNIGIRKPDIKFYEYFLEKYQLEPKETLFIGNDYIDLKGANDMGIDSLYLHTNLSNGLPENIEATYKILDGDIRKIFDIINVG
ncbi:MAG: HAD family hydrolase [Vallitalea sp.]|jgi:putative hydrolase of the HAD superfamily|nr:HAD family hydrolase [Vallitalea sp.]